MSFSNEGEEITLRWILDRVSIRHLWYGVSVVVALLSSVAYFAFFLGESSSWRSISEMKDFYAEREILKNEIDQLRATQSNLRAQITALEVEKRVANMTDEEVRNSLKERWERSQKK